LDKYLTLNKIQTSLALYSLNRYFRLVFRDVTSYITKNKTPNKLNFPFSSPCGGSPEGEGGKK